MAVTVQDILAIDAVFAGLELLRNDLEIAECGTALGSEIITEGGMLVLGQSHGVAVQGRKLLIPRDRMIVETSSVRTRVARQYPANIEDVESVVSLSKHAIASTDLQGTVPSSFGFNMELVYDQDSGQNAHSYLGRRLFSRASDLHEEWGYVGGSGKLLVHEEAWRWTINLDPRFQAADTSKVFLGANLHLSEARIPGDDEMDMLLRELWNRVHGLIENLDGRNHE